MAEKLQQREHIMELLGRRVPFPCSAALWRPHLFHQSSRASTGARLPFSSSGVCADLTPLANRFQQKQMAHIISIEQVRKGVSISVSRHTYTPYLQLLSDTFIRLKDH